MAELQQFPVVAADGSRGTIYRRSRFLDRDEHSIVRMDDGREFEVPASAVRVRPDGTFVLDLPPNFDRPLNGDTDREARTEYHRPDGDGAVEIREPLFAEEAAVERVPVNRLIDQEPQTRQDGDVTIIPIVEEVLVVEKRLLLKEEIRIRRTRSQVRDPKRILLDGSDVRVIDSRGNDLRS